MAQATSDRLGGKFKKIRTKAKAAAVAALRQGAYEIAELQYSLAPVDDGDLRNSIEVTSPGEMTPPYSQPGGRQIAREGQFLITAGNTKVRYAHLVEYGTAPHVNAGQFPGTLNPGTKAQPFFWPGYRALRKRVKSRVTRAINKAVKDGAGG
ncbi:HK97-gp10 family putative phage morphogenesis protein [Mesorhizobium retamae]|uniref:HK97 gp10 family phage protein n=1 Tax=Mesorhizobium retamae TaxID=2912854 RepID=A0ABS9QHZ5_9HYPH|nr:HK97-gp10 family putative phage morphogenesis protein [Mesorhizobium sp. IRAMC:0171]MCG7507063.1 HK97 gp10 family phage protein [Mesorhizobium sp. IRAMC:0171]